MHYHFKIHKEGTGFWAECLEIPGCVTQGDSKEELVDNINDAINLVLEEPIDSKYLAPLPNSKIKTSRTVWVVKVDPEVAFAFLVRYHRIKQRLTQKDVAARLGMNRVYSYQRLERRCNPSLDMIVKLAEIYPKLSLDRMIR